MPRRVWESDKDFRHKRGAIARHFRRADTGGKKWHQLWSNRAALATAGMSGFLGIWSAFQDHVPLVLFATVATVGPMLTVGLRMLNQDKSDGSED